MINRVAEKELRSLAKQFKAVAVVGPRQSGKTTLVKFVFTEKTYVSLENPDTRRFALEDPRGFLNQFPDGAILDEVQRTPDLFSYLQQILDENNKPGFFILTGSNNFLMQENISQSLAGRIAYLNLFPLSISEISAGHPIGLQDCILQGGYPAILDQGIDFNKWYLNYIRTYIERDVRQIKNITDLNAFERVLRLCAGRIGQLLNKQSLSIEAGVDGKTIDSWLGVLEQSFIIRILHPYYKNFNKRVVKMPKLYFTDTGLACTFLGIRNKEQLSWHPLFGSLFENLIISDLIKIKHNHGLPGELYFWRDNVGHEIDVLMEKGHELFPIEIKAGQTIMPDFFKGLKYWEKLSSEPGGAIIYGGLENQPRSNEIEVISWKTLDDRIYGT